MKLKAKYYVPVICVLLAWFLFEVVHALGIARERAVRIGCQCNVKQIMIALHLYAEKYDGWFPDKDGDAGLEMLRQENWHGQKLMGHPYALSCPSARPIQPDSIGYDYVAGHRKDSDKNIGIVMDKVGNHKEYGNIGFVDGRALQFWGKDWRKNARPKPSFPTDCTSREEDRPQPLPCAADSAKQE
ncbi:MAG: DUF1559 domain-containing protein [Lentisphaeria bacterium]|nr:DUF1559 domain-containing protein [Lentisphaeria bacterium]